MGKYKNAWNILSNYGNKVWSIVSIFIFIPIYIKFLGIESFAVIGFYTLLLGIISFADSGLTSAVIKEFSSTSKSDYKYSVLKLIEKYYIFICFSIALLIFVFSPLIAKYWLTSDTITILNLTYYIRLIGVGIVLQLLVSLYNGALFGLNHQVEANAYQIIWNVFKSLGAVFALLLINKSLEVFFIWQIVCNLIYVIFVRFRVIFRLRQLGVKLTMVINKIPKEIITYISGMILIAIVAAINTQADKIITSYLFPLKLYGYYTIASTLAQGPIMLGIPLAFSVFPLLSNLVSIRDYSKLKNTFLKSTFILNNLVILTGILLVLYTKEILIFWTKTSIEINYLDDILITSKLLIIGSVFLALQLLFYYGLLAFGETKYNIRQGIVQVLIGIPILYFLVNFFGTKGAGISWIIINLGSLVYLFFILTNKYLKINKLKFLSNNLIIPFFCSILICSIFYAFHINFIVSILISGILSVFVNVMIYNIINGYKTFSYSGILL